MLIDFKEIPPSNSTSDKQDIFEKFCRDFLEIMGYEIVSGPARGADGGLDIKVCEHISGINTVQKIYWLASCKHYAHSSKSITKEIETDIRDRVESHGCSGFIGLYSTIAHQSLLNSLTGLSCKIGFQLFDNEKIEKHLIGVHTHENILLRYFPDSYKKWKELYYYTEPIKLFENYLEKNHKYRTEIFNNIFHSSGNFIKKIRQFDDVKSAIESENTAYYIVDEFSSNMFHNISLAELMDFRLGEFLEKKINKSIVHKLLSFTFSSNFHIDYAHYPNFLFVSPDKNKEFNLMYAEFKELLN